MTASKEMRTTVIQLQKTQFCHNHRSSEADSAQPQMETIPEATPEFQSGQVLSGNPASPCPDF